MRHSKMHSTYLKLRQVLSYHVKQLLPVASRALTNTRPTGNRKTPSYWVEDIGAHHNGNVTRLSI
jgi:hypothetical protein